MSLVLERSIWRSTSPRRSSASKLSFYYPVCYGDEMLRQRSVVLFVRAEPDRKLANLTIKLKNANKGKGVASPYFGANSFAFAYA